MSYNLHDFDHEKHTEKYNSLSNSIKNRLIFLPNESIIDSNFKKQGLNQHQNHLNILQKIRTWPLDPSYTPDPENDQWLWLGTYGGHNMSATYNSKSLIRLLYKHFINPDLPDNKRLTTFSTVSLYDVNPYKISTSFSTPSSRFTHNLRKAINKELPQTPFERAKLPLVKELDKSSFEYRDISDCLIESGFIEMGKTSEIKEMAIQYLIGEGFNPVHSKQVVDEHIK